MEKKFILKGLDCPHCSSEIEREISRMDGIIDASITLFNQTLTVKTNVAETDGLYEKIKAVVKKHEPKVVVTEIIASNNLRSDKDSNKPIIIRLSAGAVLFAIALMLKWSEVSFTVELILLIASYVILGFDVVFKAIKNITKGRIFDENFLMSISTVGAFIIGEYPEAVAVMLFYQVGEFFQSVAVNRSRRSISELMDIRPDYAVVKRDEATVRVSPEDVKIGEEIVIKPGEKIPLDGFVTDGTSYIDARALTGESVPKSVSCGDEVLSGCINTNGVITVKVAKAYSDSTASKIIELVENASARKAPAENFITSFSRYYTPAVVICAVLISTVFPMIFGDFSEWIHRGFVFLVISCPCALVISIPLTFFGGIGAASKKGVLIKGGNYLDALGKVKTFVFDKTGTLTKGVFTVTKLVPSEGFSEEQLLSLGAAAECMSNHPIAKSIITACGKDIDKSMIAEYKEFSGYGTAARINGHSIFAGNEKFMDKLGVSYTKAKEAGTKVYIALDTDFAGCIIISDEVKDDSKKAIKLLKENGVKKCVMLTGDSRESASYFAEKIGMNEYYAELLPEDKVKILEKLSRSSDESEKLAFVGDGINDAPVLARADIGIAMGGLGSDAAIEAADIVLMTDEPSKLCDVLAISKETKRIVLQNIVFALGVKLVFLILGAFGIAGMWEAVFGDVGVMVIAVLNSMRILR